MKFQSSKKTIAFLFISFLAFINAACQKAQTSVNQTAANQETANREAVKTASPTEAYKMLFAAVKAKDTGKIKQLMSKESLALAALSSQTYKQSMEKSLENGFLDTTFADALPEIRDERIKDNFGAIEVFNKKSDKFDDTFFILEDGSWKLAVGDLIKGTYKSPGKGQAQIEADKTNPMMNGVGAPNAKTGNVKTVEVPVENAGKPPVQDKKK